MRSIAALALFATACFGSSYIPKPSPYIQVTTNWAGSTTFWKDGKKLQAGYWSKDIFKVFEKLPKAREHIETWRSRQVLSFILNVFSSVITATGLFIIEPGSGFNSRNTLSIAMLVGGAFPVSMTGLVYGLSAGSHLWDAVNLYNDDLKKKRGQRSAVRLGPGGLAVQW